MMMTNLLFTAGTAPAGIVYDGEDSPIEFVTKFTDWCICTGLKKQGQAIALLKASLKNGSSPRLWFEDRERKSPFPDLETAVKELVRKFYTNEMKQQEIREVDEPSFVQEQNESVDSFVGRFNEARLRCDRGRKALNLPERSEEEHCFNFRGKVLPYLQAELKRFNIAMGVKFPTLIKHLKNYEGARKEEVVHSVSRVRGRERTDETHRATKHPRLNTGEPDRYHSTHDHTINSLQAQVEEKDRELRQMRAEREQKQRVREEQLRGEAEEAQRKARETQMVHQITRAVRDELQQQGSASNNTGQRGRQGTRQLQDVQCFRCNQMGHYAAACPQNGANQRQTPNNRTRHQHRSQPRTGRTETDRCIKCGGAPHTDVRQECPAWEAKCGKCSYIGHFTSACQRRSPPGTQNGPGPRRNDNRNAQPDNNALMRQIQALQQENRQILNSLAIVDNNNPGNAQ